MKFERRAISQTTGCILGHSIYIRGTRISKGTPITEDMLARMKAAGLSDIWIAELEPGDVDENTAATTVAKTIAGKQTLVEQAEKGRVNIRAKVSGLLSYVPAEIVALNTVDSSITCAVLDNHSFVQKGQLIATTKIIPFAVSQSGLSKLQASISPLLNIHPIQYDQATIILTKFPDTPEKLIKKAETSLKQRLVRMGIHQINLKIRDHHEAAIAEALQNSAKNGPRIILVLGISAILDNNDVVPTALQMAGGKVNRVGMPVDPGNLLMLGKIEKSPVIGVPGCARSPMRNGFDLVLERVAARHPPTDKDFAAMAIGGLMKEGTERPRPRENRQQEKQPHIQAIILAAGASRRMGSLNKLLTKMGDTEILKQTINTLQVANIENPIVVTGHDHENVQASISDSSISYIHAKNWEDGMSESLKTGLEALNANTDWVLVMLGDMPEIKAQTLQQLINKTKETQASILIPTYKGKRGNPVLWHSSLFENLKGLQGDKGGKQLFQEHQEKIEEVPVDDPGILLDIDTVESLNRLQKNYQSTS